MDEPNNVQSNAPNNEQENVDSNVQQTTDFLNATQLKKKEVQSKNSKRTKTWIDKLCKGKRKPTKSATSTTKGAKQQKKNDGVQPRAEVENHAKKKEANVVHEEYNIGSFTQLLTAPTSDDGILYDRNLFYYLEIGI